VAGIDHHQFFAAGRFRRRFAVLIAQQALPNSATARPESKSWRRVGETVSGLKLRNCLPCFFITQRSIDVSILRRYIVLIIINRPDNYFHLLRLLPAISGQIAR